MAEPLAQRLGSGNVIVGLPQLLQHITPLPGA